MVLKFNIKTIRKAQGVNLKQLSYKTGISTSHLCDIENNYKMPSLIYAVKIAKALKIKLEEIYFVERY